MDRTKQPDWVALFQTSSEDEVLRFLEVNPVPAPDSDRSPSFIAVVRDHRRVVEKLLSSGDSIESGRGHFASVSMAELLRQHCRPLSSPEHRFALGRAIERENSELCEWLLQDGAVPDAETVGRAVMQADRIPRSVLRAVPEEERPACLEKAAFYARDKLVDRLLALDTDPKQCDALHDAASAGASEIVRALVSAGDEPNRLGRHGDIAIVSAAFEGELETVQVLLELGADPKLRNRHGQSALDGAREFGKHLERLLLDAGADSARRPDPSDA